MASPNCILTLRNVAEIKDTVIKYHHITSYFDHPADSDKWLVESVTGPPNLVLAKGNDTNAGSAAFEHLIQAFHLSLSIQSSLFRFMVFESSST